MEKLGEFELNKIYCMDCLEGLKKIPDNSIDLVLTDPPYNASNSKISFEDKHFTSINEDWDKGFNIDFFNVIANKVRDGGTILIHCSYHLLGEYLTKIPKGIKLRQIIHWVKNGAVPALCGRLYGFSVEYILWFTKGVNYTFNKKFWDNYTNVIITNVKDKEQKKQLHPTQKHLSVMRKLLLVHSNENEVILDCFMGSGTTAMACKNTNRKFIGFEINPEYVKIANKRLQQEVLSI